MEFTQPQQQTKITRELRAQQGIISSTPYRAKCQFGHCALHCPHETGPDKNSRRPVGPPA